MDGARPPGKNLAWGWSVVFVTALHLLTTAGTWWITDHGEILAAADHFMASGQMNLEALGPGWESWTRIASARGSTETRFLPLSILPLTPFLALDHLFGLPPSAFRFVHLEGHAFVTLTLILAGRWLSKVGAAPQTIALSVVLLGLNWPVWMMSRRLGPEPVLFFFLTLFATGEARTKFSTLVLLPWVHASGALLGLGALCWSFIEPRSGPRRSHKMLIAGWAVGVASVILLWNLPRGHALMGGYGRYSSDPFFVTQNPLIGSITLLAPMLVWCFALFLGAWARQPQGLVSLSALWWPAVIFFGAFSSHEAERRLMPLLGASLITAAPLSRMPPQRIRTLLVVTTIVLGALGLSSDFVDVVQTPLGVYSGPILLWLRLGLSPGGGQAALFGLMALTALAVFAGSRTVLSMTDRPSEPRRA